METIKNFIVGAAKFAYAIFVSPIVEMKNIMSKTLSEKIVATLNAISRVIIIASWFVTVPTLLITLAWVWFWLTLVVAVAYVTFVTLSGAAGLALFMTAVNKAAEAQVAEEAVPAAA